MSVFVAAGRCPADEKDFIKLADAVTVVGETNIVSFIEQLISIINIKNKPGDRVLDVYKTEVVLVNNLVKRNGHEWCIRNAEKKENKQTGGSKLQHYFMEVIELVEKKTGKIFEIRNNITFESLKECYCCAWGCATASAPTASTRTGTRTPPPSPTRCCVLASSCAAARGGRAGRGTYNCITVAGEAPASFWSFHRFCLVAIPTYSQLVNDEKHAEIHFLQSAGKDYFSLFIFILFIFILFILFRVYDTYENRSEEASSLLKQRTLFRIVVCRFRRLSSFVDKASPVLDGAHF
jgi:hypothetical protein